MNTSYDLVLGSYETARQIPSCFAVQRWDTPYIGTQATGSGGYLLAINTKNGSLRWKTQLDPHPLSIDTSSPVVLNGVGSPPWRRELLRILNVLLLVPR